MKDLYWGIDIGSVTVKVVIIDQERKLLAQRYLRSQGQPQKVLLQAVEELSPQFPLHSIAGVGLSGSGGGAVARLIGCPHVNELVAQTRAVGEFYPQTRTVIEIGGQDSKFLSVQWDEQNSKMVLADFAMNNLCAAGTGSFLDQQAERLGISIVDEFAEIAMQSDSPARVAGRCTVFAKSDMVHLQQKGTSLADILAGLCLAMTRNYRSVIGTGKQFTPPILFQGGVASNRAVVRAFETVLNLEPGQLIVPEQHLFMAALGTALLTLDEVEAGRLAAFAGFGGLKTFVENGRQPDRNKLPILLWDDPVQATLSFSSIRNQFGNGKGEMPVYIGIDVGSISTNVVVLDEQSQLVARRYLYTAGRPLEAVRHGLHEVGQEIGQPVRVLGVGSTGSGRYLTGHYVGADVVRNEITAQARAAIEIDPTVDTIFEIGGQDSKYVSIYQGAIVDFAMNNACAAGTGSFLQEQADRLQIEIQDEFSDMAFAAPQPACLGERCTVFMESDLVHHQQQGAQIADLTAGLAYSIAQNYLNRVVDGRDIGQNIFFQGGVAWNKSVVSAFRQLTKRPITVPPNHDVTGAMGAALLAKEARQQGDFEVSHFKGFNLADRHYESQVFECKQCPNLCEVNKVVIRGESPIYFGARCDIFEEAGRKKNQAKAIPDLFAERTAMLMGDYVPPVDGSGRLRVAMPRALTFYDLFPYWRAFFNSLEMDIVLSEVTNPRIMGKTAVHAAVEMCLPAKLVFGHVADLRDKQADYLFLPSVVNRENMAPGQRHNVYCPFIQSVPQLVMTHMDLETNGQKMLTFPYFMLWEPVQKEAHKRIAAQLQIPLRRIQAAAKAGKSAQADFYRQLRQRGQEVLAELAEGQTAVVIVGRPYNTADPGACQDLPYKLRKLGVLPIPMDFLPLETADISAYYNNMFWRCGQDILAAATIIRNDPRLQALYLTNFGCGPDSFITSFFSQIMGDKPFLELEIDDHTADAGVMTRCEAFLESLRMGAARPKRSKEQVNNLPA